MQLHIFPSVGTFFCHVSITWCVLFFLRFMQFGSSVYIKSIPSGPNIGSSIHCSHHFLSIPYLRHSQFCAYNPLTICHKMLMLFHECIKLAEEMQGRSKLINVNIIIFFIEGLVATPIGIRNIDKFPNLETRIMISSTFVMKCGSGLNLIVRNSIGENQIAALMTAGRFLNFVGL